MNGFLIVDKPSGMTSHDVIARIRKALGERRVGHAGTLDPMATGVLLVGVGRGARLLRFLEGLEKSYRGDVVFGVTTATQDAEGEVRSQKDASGVDPDAVARALDKFRGTIQQVPPMVSAIKVDGERLYRKARRGEEVVRAPREVTIYSLDLVAFETGEHPRAIIDVRCSKGTYIRSLAADLGDALGVGAHLGALRRTAIGPFTAAAAVELNSLTVDALRPLGEAVAGSPRHDVDADGVRTLVQGKSLPAAGIAGTYAIFGPDGLVAMAEDRGEEARSLCVLTQ